MSSVLLFTTRYVRYLMAFWCILFMKVLMLDFGIYSLVSLSMECSCISSCDGNEGVGCPSIILYGVN